MKRDKTHTGARAHTGPAVTHGMLTRSGSSRANEMATQEQRDPGDSPFEPKDRTSSPVLYRNINTCGVHEHTGTARTHTKQGMTSPLLQSAETQCRYCSNISHEISTMSIIECAYKRHSQLPAWTLTWSPKYEEPWFPTTMYSSLQARPYKSPSIFPTPTKRT